MQAPEATKLTMSPDEASNISPVSSMIAMDQPDAVANVLPTVLHALRDDPAVRMLKAVDAGL